MSSRMPCKSPNVLCGVGLRTPGRTSRAAWSALRHADCQRLLQSSARQGKSRSLHVDLKVYIVMKGGGLMKEHQLRCLGRESVLGSASAPLACALQPFTSPLGATSGPQEGNCEPSSLLALSRVQLQ